MITPFNYDLVKNARIAAANSGPDNGLKAALAAYETAWDTGESYGWHEDNIQVLMNAESDLKRFVNTE